MHKGIKIMFIAFFIMAIIFFALLAYYIQLGHDIKEHKRILAYYDSKGLYVCDYRPDVCKQLGINE
jgi:hypothetical protein